MREDGRWKDWLRSNRLPAALLVFIVGYGALLRVSELLENPHFEHPDAERHFIAAEEISLIRPTTWFAVHRGYLPFAVWNRLVFEFTSHHPVSQRFGTVLLSILLMVAVFNAAKTQVGAWGGLFAAFLIASSPPLIDSSDSGIRTEMLILFWVLAYAVLFHWNRPRSGGRAQWIGGGLLLSAVVLVRVDAIFAVLAVALMSMFQRSVWTEPKALVPSGILVTLLWSAIFFANWHRFEDPFYFTDPQKNTFRYWANLEFKGEPGFPSREEVEEFSRVGEPLSPFEYFGETLGWKETASRFYRGCRSLILGNVATGIYAFGAFPNHIGWVGLLTIVGAIVSFARKDFVLPLFIPLLAFSTIWTYHVPGGRDFRFFLPAIPFAAILAAQGLKWIWEVFSCIRFEWFKFGIRTVFVGLVLLNPWNHDLDRSFPWRVGPVATVDASEEIDPLAFGDHLSLVGWKMEKIGPLGLWSSSLESLEAGERFRIRSYWKCVKPIKGEAEYRVILTRDSLGEFGSTRPHPITKKFPLRHWREGNIVVDEVERIVFPRVPAGTTTVILKVRGAGLPDEATAEIGTFQVDVPGWSLINSRNWG